MEMAHISPRQPTFYSPFPLHDSTSLQLQTLASSMDSSDSNSSQNYRDSTSRDFTVPATNSWVSSRELSPHNMATRHIRSDDTADYQSQTVISGNSTLVSSAERLTTPLSPMPGTYGSGLYQEPATYLRAHALDNNQLYFDGSQFENANFSMPASNQFLEGYSRFWETNRTSSDQRYREDSISSDFHDLSGASSTPLFQSSPDKAYICPAPGCGVKISKKADFRRHWSTKHDPQAKRFLCGCCETGKSPIFKRLDKLKEHKRKHHNFTGDQLLKSCPDCHGEDGLDTLYFCSQDEFQCHNRKCHQHHCVDPPSIPKRGSECEIGGMSKKIQVHEAGSAYAESKSTSETPLLENLDLYKSLNLSGYSLAAVPVNTITVGNVRFADVMKLFEKVKEIRIQAKLQRTGNSSDALLVCFNALKRSVKLQGPQSFLHDLLRILNERLSSKIPRAYDSSLYLFLSKSQSPAPTKDNSNDKKIFAMKKAQDADFLRVWHEDVIPRLPDILKCRIGLNYSVSLVRIGRSDLGSRVAIHIQCNSLPSLSVKQHIRQKIIELMDVNLGFSKDQIQFFEGRLKTIAGSASEDGSDQTLSDLDMNSGDEDEVIEYPWYSRYHLTPGPGASIGLACTNEISATIGCYVVVDGQTYILTVKHLVTKSRDNRMEGNEDIRTAVSPALADVNDLKENIQQCISDLTFELEELLLGTEFSGDVSLDTIMSLPEPTKVILEKRDLMTEDLRQLMGDPENLILGSVFVESDENSGLAGNSSGNGPSYSVPKPHELDHHFDWALFKVLPHRLGSNRHRYHFDREQNIVDFYSGNTDSCGAGEPIVETSVVIPNDKVHFVGQGTGRQSGEINAAQILISIDGQPRVEWAVILSPERQGDAERHRGDSGASIIREDDNKLVGLLWACTKSGQLVFTPINSVFADIQRRLDAKEVRLPPNHPAPSVDLPLPAAEVVQICRDKTMEKPKPRKAKFRSSHMQTKPRSLPTSLSKSSLSSSIKPLVDRETSKLLDQDKENRHSLKYILTEPSPATLLKSKTMSAPKRHSIFFKAPFRGNTWPRLPILSSLSVY